MKTLTLTWLITLGLLIPAAAQDMEEPENTGSTTNAVVPALPEPMAETNPIEQLPPEQEMADAPPTPEENGRTPTDSETPVPAQLDAPPPSRRNPASSPSRRLGNSQDLPMPPRAAGPGDKTLRLNFRNAPLEMVLNYLSEAAGFIIDLQTEVKGKVDVWSNQPLTKEEAVDVLNSVLKRNGYAAVRNGRTLTIVSREEARKYDLPVKSGSDPDKIPKNDEIVTQIIPVRYINAVQLIQNLQPLLPSEASMTANDSGNALILTDTQTNIRRISEIVRALDTAISSASIVEVFTLTYADAKSLATVIKELFQSQETGRSTSNQGPMGGRFQNFFRGGGPGGAPGAPSTTSSSSGGRAPTPRVTAVADERSNSLVVSAPEEQMPIIRDLVRQVDTSVENITELRLFKLKFADPQETADLLTSLFPTTSSTQNQRSQFQFAGGRLGGPGMMRGGAAGANNNTSGQSSRMLMQTQVTAVPDLRTSSVVVSAARDLMPQIANIIQELDADPAKKQQVYVFPVENADPAAIQEVLENLFPNQNINSGRASSTTRNSTRAGNQLNQRATSTQNNMGRSGSSSRTGNNGIGGSFGGTTGR